MTIERIEHRACSGGWQDVYEHASSTLGCTMRFAVYLPPQAERRRVPVLWYLAGLTCTEETFMIKAGAQRIAAQLGLMLVAPDTSPRNARVPGDDASWDFGIGAGFYVDATQAPWSQHYRMYSYVTRELPEIVQSLPNVLRDRQSVFGHSMGGHGALVCALRNPDRYRSVSAFAPIAAPSQCPWGLKAFTGYLGDERTAWSQYDASELVARQAYHDTILIDQGTADKFLDQQLLPERFAASCRASNTKLQLNYRDGYDHGYYFISSFMEQHLVFHAQRLR